jgi:glycosyltransferase involved in cell wall biosynthesis
MSENSNIQKAFMILGPPRSGTSALAHVINRLGVDFGDPARFVDAELHPWNPIFYELLSLNDLNDEIFEAFSTQYVRFDWLPDVSDFSESTINKFVGPIKSFIREEFRCKSPIGLKDPRFCYTLPIWQAVLARLEIDVTYVISQRLPSATLSSNTKINGNSLGANFKMIAESSLLAEHFTRGEKRICVRYEDLLRNTETTISAIASELNLDAKLVPGACKVIESSLNHEAQEVGDSSNFKFFDSYIGDVKSPSMEWDIYKEIVAAATEDIGRELRETQARSESVQALYDSVKQENDSLRKELDLQASVQAEMAQEFQRASGQIQELKDSCSEKDQRIEELNFARSGLVSDINMLQRRILEQDSHLSSFKRRILDQDNHIADFQRSYTWKFYHWSHRIISRLRELVHGEASISDDRYGVSGNLGLGRIVFRKGYYLEQNHDVADSGLDPYVHFVRYGKAEGRRGRPPGLVDDCIRIFYRSFSTFREEGLLTPIKNGFSVLKKEGIEGVASRFRSGNFDLCDDSYPRWICQFEAINDADRSEIRAHISEWARPPKISIVMPTYNSSVEWLGECLDSVTRQLYENWELCIADDASTDIAVKQFLQHSMDGDSRIKVVFREENGHISRASNSALEVATGEWIALLDHDDLLSEDALYQVAAAINSNPQLSMIYSDEDKIDETGERSDPYFKSDWNVDLFYSQNMFSHLGVYRRELIEDIGGFRVGFEGAQDYDLALRCTEIVELNQIYHIPKVLYHWRVHEESTSSGGEAKPYAMLAGERALNDHFSRTGINAEAELIGHGYRVHYALPSPPPLVTIIIPTRDRKDLLEVCISSILEKTEYNSYEILIIDNGSSDRSTVEYLDELSRNESIRIIRDDSPFNYSALNNRAVRQARGELVALLNNDIEVISSNWLSEMVSHAVRPGVGAVGARLWYKNKTLQHCGVVCGLGADRVAGHCHHKMPREHHGYFGRASLVSNFSAITAACLVIKKTTYLEVGGLNENELKVAFNDVDFCLKLVEKGYRNVVTPFADLFHYESETRGSDLDDNARERYLSEVAFMHERWGKILQADPMFSPNLCLQDAGFKLAWPPRI